MKTNTHPIDRAIRVVGGLTISSLAFWGPMNYWFLLGMLPVATGLVGWSPLYSLFGFNTNKGSAKKGKATKAKRHHSARKAA